MTQPNRSRALGWTLVALQGVIFLAVGLSALTPGPAIAHSLWAGLIIMMFGGLGMFWAGKDLGRALTPLPEPNGAGLAGGGIYGYVRHPMYSAIVAIGLGLAVASGHVWTYAFTALLLVFFEAKTRVEEAMLLRAYPGYRGYAERTGKFVPGVGRLRA